MSEAKYLKTRNDQICADHTSGMKIWDISRKYGLTWERIEQIIRGRENQQKLATTCPIYAAVSVRVINALKNEGIDPSDTDRICRLTESEFLRIPNCGRESLNELKAYLASIGRCLNSYKTPGGRPAVSSPLDTNSEKPVFSPPQDCTSLRDWLAGQALVGMGTWCPNKSNGYSYEQEDRLTVRAAWAYAQADAMLAARKKGGGQ